jgi:hypothetical protein
MLAICLLAVGAFAADTEAPVISLNLAVSDPYVKTVGGTYINRLNAAAGQTGQVHQENALAAADLATGTKSWNTAQLAACQQRPSPNNDHPEINGRDHVDRRDSCYNRNKNHFVAVEEYVAGMKGSAAKLPSATAYDIHDTDTVKPEAQKVIMVAEATKCTDADVTIGSNGNCDANLVTDLSTTFPQASWNGRKLQRAEYVASWRAEDRAGNQAEVVAYSVIIRDTEAPKMTSQMNYDRPNEYEFRTQLPQVAVRFSDNYDAVMKITEKINSQNVKVNVGQSIAVKATKPLKGFNLVFDKCVNGEFRFAYEVRDSANIFGANNADNVLKFDQAFKVKDTTIPNIGNTKSDQKNVDIFECDTPRFAKGINAARRAGDKDIPTPFFGAKGHAVDPSNGYFTFDDTINTCANLGSKYSAFETVVHEFNFNGKVRHGSQCANIYNGKRHQVGSCTVNYVSIDWAGLKSLPIERTYKIVDTKAPVISTNHKLGSKAKLTHKYIPNTKLAQKMAEKVHQKDFNAKKFNNAQGGVTKLSLNGNENTIFHSLADNKVGEFDIDAVSGKGKGEQAFRDTLLDITCDDACVGPNRVSERWTWHGEGACTTPASGADWTTESKPYSLTDAGTYVLKYECRDESKNYAVKCRTVVNEEATKPIIDINCKTDQDVYDDGYNRCDEITIPAQMGGFNDPGAQCFSYQEGNINSQVVPSGASINLAKVGTYKVTYNCAATGRAGDARYQAEPAIRTVYVVDGAPPSCEVTTDVLSCETNKKNCRAAYNESHPWTESHHLALPYDWTEDQEASFPYTDAVPLCSDNTDNYLGKKFCPQQITGQTLKGKKTIKRTSLHPDANGDCTYDSSPSQFVNVEKTGNYVLTYTVNDENVNEAKYMKTVKVLDRLAPEIVLSYTGTGLMEENTFVNGWVVGAVASAITGIAMLAISSKNSVATSVPV